MADPIHPDTLARRLADLERRLAALERSPQLTNSSIREGRLRILDDAGGYVAEIGSLLDGDFGVAVSKPDGSGGIDTTHLWVRSDDGLRAPGIAIPWARYDGVTNDTNSASWADLFRVYFRYIVANTLVTTFHVLVDSGVTAQIRLRNSSTAGTSDSMTITNTTVARREFRWLHGSPLGWYTIGGPPEFTFQARITAGSGYVRVYPPGDAFFASNYNSGSSGGIYE